MLWTNHRCWLPVLGKHPIHFPKSSDNFQSLYKSAKVAQLRRTLHFRRWFTESVRICFRVLRGPFFLPLQKPRRWSIRGFKRSRKRPQIYLGFSIKPALIEDEKCMNTFTVLWRKRHQTASLWIWCAKWGRCVIDLPQSTERIVYLAKVRWDLVKGCNRRRHTEQLR